MVSSTVLSRTSRLADSDLANSTAMSKVSISANDTGSKGFGYGGASSTPSAPPPAPPAADEEEDEDVPPPPPPPPAPLPPRVPEPEESKAEADEEWDDAPPAPPPPPMASRPVVPAPAAVEEDEEDDVSGGWPCMSYRKINAHLFTTIAGSSPSSSTSSHAHARGRISSSSCCCCASYAFPSSSSTPKGCFFGTEGQGVVRLRGEFAEVTVGTEEAETEVDRLCCDSRPS